MKITKEKAAMLCMALRLKIEQLNQLPEPIGPAAAEPFVELYQEIAKEFLTEQTSKTDPNSS